MNSTPKIWVIPFDDKRLTPKTVQYLNQQERAKAQNFFHQRDQKNYQLSHIYLREILTLYSPTLSPKDWRFKFNRYGKPFIANQGYQDIYFNISHTKTHFAMIISDRVCGIDIEQEGSIEIDQNILDFVLTQKEQKIIREKNISFYTIWTLKEAHLKAKGSGLSTPLHEIEFLSIEESSIFKRGEYYYKTQQIEDGISLSWAVIA